MSNQKENFDTVTSSVVEDDEIAFDYIKSSDFKMIWADGAVGGLTPSGNMHVAFYSERNAIPKREVFKIDNDAGEVGEQVDSKTISRNSIVREMSCDLVLQPKVAKALADWILEYLELIEETGE